VRPFFKRLDERFESDFIFIICLDVGVASDLAKCEAFALSEEQAIWRLVTERHVAQGVRGEKSRSGRPA
jgi:hypothetical protein